MKKRVYLLGGNASRYSKSPSLWNHVYGRMGMGAHYEAKDAKNDDALEALLSEISANSSILGANVTIPWKERVLHRLSEVSTFVELAGAANLIARKPDGTLRGENTDGPGVRDALDAWVPGGSTKLSGKDVAILGAGGVAKAVALVLRELGANLFILSRSRAQGEALARSVSGEWSNPALFSKHPVLWIQCTPAGQTGNPEPLPFSWNEEEWAGLLDATKGSLLWDLVYAPEETPFLRIGREKGHGTLNGKSLLIAQAVRSFEILHENEIKSLAIDRANLLKAFEEAWDAG